MARSFTGIFTLKTAFKNHCSLSVISLSITWKGKLYLMKKKIKEQKLKWFWAMRRIYKLEDYWLTFRFIVFHEAVSYFVIKNSLKCTCWEETWLSETCNSAITAMTRIRRIFFQITCFVLLLVINAKKY